MLNTKLITAMALSAGLTGLTGLGHAQSTMGQSVPGTPKQQSLQQSATVSLQDQQFIRQAAASSMAEIQHSQLALLKSSTPAIRTLANKMIQDHTQASNELMRIASRMGMTLPQTLDSPHQAIQTQLTGLSGTAFDQAYMRHMLDAHQQDIALFRSESTQGGAPELRMYALTTLPSLETHLASLQQQAVAMRLPGVQTQSAMSSMSSQQTVRSTEGGNGMTTTGVDMGQAGRPQPSGLSSASAVPPSAGTSEETTSTTSTTYSSTPSGANAGTERNSTVPGFW